MHEIPDKYNGAPGKIYMAEAKYLYNAPFRLGDGLYGDIGTFKGRSGVALAAGVIESKINGKVITVDRKRRYIKDQFKAFKVDCVVDVIIERSVKAATHFYDKTFRCIFIDANHSYEGVKADFVAWGPKVDKDGELAFHDTTTKSGVIQFLKELEEEGIWEKIGIARTLSWWKRVV